MALAGLREAATAWLRVGAESQQELARRCSLVTLGGEAFLATAPHNVFLGRDGQRPHTLEEMTSALAMELARALRGSCLCWSREAQWHTELRFALGQRLVAEGAKCTSEALDERNRDPNYLRPEELEGNPWFQKVRLWVGDRAGAAAGTGHVLHVDVHGCMDPPRHPAHAMLGLGAMRQLAEGLPEGPEQDLARRRVASFAEALEGRVREALGPVLATAGVQGEPAVLTGMVPTPPDVSTLSGAWPPELGRFTQTQQSVHAGASHAVQLELGRTLRRLLARDAAAVRRLADALRDAWRSAVAAEV